MGLNVLKDCKFYLGGYNLSGGMNKLEIKTSNAKLKATTFGANTQHYNPGLKEVQASHAGFVTLGTDEIDDVLNTAWGAVDQIMTACAQTGAAGETAESFKGLMAQYVPSGQVGELFGFVVEASASDSNMVRATICETGAKTSTANGTSRQLGAVTATQKIYCIQHVIAVSGTNPTLDTIIASDDDTGFASGVTRATFAQATARTAEWIEVSGAITDDWWRPEWTIGGTDTPTFTIVVLLAIM